MLLAPLGEYIFSSNSSAKHEQERRIVAEGEQREMSNENVREVKIYVFEAQVMTMEANIRRNKHTRKKHEISLFVYWDNR